MMLHRMWKNCSHNPKIFMRTDASTHIGWIIHVIGGESLTVVVGICYASPDMSRVCDTLDCTHSGSRQYSGIVVFF